MQERGVREVVPFLVMVGMEGCTIALTISAMTMISKGMSPFVFVVYTHALSSLILFPYCFIFHYKDCRFSISLSFPCSSYLPTLFLWTHFFFIINLAICLFNYWFILQNTATLVHFQSLPPPLLHGLNRVCCTNYYLLSLIICTQICIYTKKFNTLKKLIIYYL